MPSVDNRIVEMRFDNKEFESGVGTSLNTIDRLKKALDFKGVDKGFNEIEAASSKVNFSSLSGAIDAVTQHFSAFGLIGDQVLRRIGDSIYDLEMKAVNLVKSMSVDQITAGWTKYGQKTASVQTILNSTGKSIDEVNEYLDRLMWYSDETSFGFTDMTSALQTMTASGGDLDNLIPMLMGIGNATAYAGKGAAEFSRIMQYSVAQAYSLGYMGTKDWMTIQGSGVNSRALQEELIRSAEELGKIDPGEYNLSNFSEALTNKIFDKDVMERAFGKFAEVTLEAEKLIDAGMFDTASEAYEYLAEKYDGVALSAATAAQEAKTFMEAVDATKDAVSSGWMTTFELLFGNYMEAKQLWTWLANEWWEVFAGGGEGRNYILKIWHNGIEGVSGYAMAIESLKNIWYSLKDVIYSVKDAVADIFPPATAGRLIEFTEKIRNATRAIRDFFTYDISDHLSEAFNERDWKSWAKESAYQRITSEVTHVSDAISALQGIIRGLAGTISIVGQVLSAFWNTIAKPILKKIGRLLFPVIQWLGDIGNKIGDLAKKLKKNRTIITAFENIVNIFKQLEGYAKTFIERVKELESFKTLTDNINKLKEKIQNLDIIGKITEKFQLLSGIKLDGLNSVIDILVSGVDWLLTQLNNLYNLIENNEGTIKGLFSSIDFSSISGFFASIGTNIGTFFTNLVSAIDIPTITAKMEEIFGGIWVGLTNSIKNIDFGKVWETFKEALGVAGDVGGLAIIIGVLKALFGIGEMFSSGASIAEGFATVLEGFGKSLNSFSKMLNATAILEIAIALVAVAGAMWILSKIPSEQLADIAIALVAVAFGISFFLKGVGAIKNATAPVIKMLNPTINIIPSFAATLISMAGSILLLIVALKQIIDIFKTTNEKDLESAFWTLGIMVAGLAGVSIAISKLGGSATIGSALGIVGIATSVLIAVEAIKKIVDLKNEFSTSDVLIAAGIIGGLMIIFGVMAKLTQTGSGGIGIQWASKKSNLISAMIAFAGIMASIRFLVVPAIVELVKNVDQTMLITAGAVIAGIFAVFSAAAVLLSSNLIKNDDTMLKAMLLIALDIGVIAASLYVLKDYEWDDVWQSVVAIAAILAMLIGASAAFGGIPIIAAGVDALSIALLAFGVSILAAGAGALMFASALSLLSDSSINCAEAGKNLAEGIVAFIQVLVDNAPLILEFVTMIITTILLAIALSKTQFITTIISVLSGIITAIGGFLSGVGGIKVLGVLAIILGLILSFIMESVGPLLSAILGVILKLINGVSRMLVENSGDLWQALLNLVEAAGLFITRGILMLGDVIANFINNTDIGKAFKAFGIDIGAEIKAGFGELEKAQTEAETSLISTLDESDERITNRVNKNIGEIKDSFSTGITGVTNAIGIGGQEVEKSIDDWHNDLSSKEGHRHTKLSPNIDVEPKLNVDTEGADTYSQNYATTLLNLLTEKVGAANIGGATNESFAQGLLSSINLPADASLEDINAVISILCGEGEAGGAKAADDTINSYTDGIKEGKDDAEAAASYVADGAIQTLESYNPRANTSGSEMSDDYASGINSKDSIDNVENASENVAKRAYVKLQEIDGEPIKQKFYKSAKDAIQGFINGLSDGGMIKNVEKASSGVAESSWKAAKAELKSNSPSKVYEEIGRDVDLGFALGINEYASAVNEATVGMTAGATKEAALACDDILHMIEDESDPEIEITVTPVVDWNDVESGLAYLADHKYVKDINGEDVFNSLYYDKYMKDAREKDLEKIFNARFFNDEQREQMLHQHYNKYKDYYKYHPEDNPLVNAKLYEELLRNNPNNKSIYAAENFDKSKIANNDNVSQITSSSKSSGSSTSTSGYGYDDTKLLAKIDDLKKQVDNLGNVVGRLQVVMDTGELVGVIAPKVDEELGSRVVMLERGA